MILVTKIKTGLTRDQLQLQTSGVNLRKIKKKHFPH